MLIDLILNQMNSNKHMDENERQLPTQTQRNDDEQNQYSFFSLFRFADRCDWLMMFMGILGSCGSGAATPLFIYFLVAFVIALNTGQDKSNNFLDEVQSLFLQIIYIGIGAFVSGWMMCTFWLITGERQATKCRRQYLQSLLKQEIGYFDCIDQSELSAKFSMNMLIIQEAIGQKMGLALQIFGCIIATFAIAFSSGWLLSLVMMASLLLLITFSSLTIVALQQKQKKFLQIYTEAGGKAQEVLSSIKTVKQLNGQVHEKSSYQNSLQQTSINLMKYCFKIALFYGLMQASIFIIYYIGLWQGSNCIEGNGHCPLSIIQNNYSMKDVGIIFFCFLGSCFTFSQLIPTLRKIGEAKVAAQIIFQIIDRIPKIKNPENGLKPEQFQGYFQLKNVTFFYPKNKSTIILKNISIKFDIFRTALFGDSGCGKSTILQLLMRFYDPEQGSILLDGINIREYDLYWLRSKIGYVGQEPVLFSGSIKDNLLMGNSNATSQEINDALKQAEAYQFVYNQLDLKLETFVGAGGGQISGGQKQRIAIARALLKKPKILLLDQATSALDRRNERLIQDTFDKISQKLTTITVAHRIRTIISSNVIYVINHGFVQQSGSFEKLKRYQHYEKQREQQEQEFIIQCPNVNEQKQFQNIMGQITKRVEKTQIRMLQEYDEAINAQNTKDVDKETDDRPWGEIFCRIFKYNKDKLCLFITAIIVAMVTGFFFPIFSIFLPRMLVSLRELQNKDPLGRQHANQSAMVFAILSAGGFVFYSLQSFLGNIIANEITNKLRLETFQKYLKMPINWFDKLENSSSILSRKLTADCQTINGVTSTFIFVLLQSLTCVIAGFVLAFVYEWRITLVAIGLVPFLVLGGAARNYFKIGLFKKIQIVHKGSEEMIMESLINIRTVISLNAEESIISKYYQQLQGSYQSVVHTGIIAGFMNGLAMILMWSIFGVLLYIGAIFIAHYNVPVGDLLTGIFQTFLIGFVLGNNMQYLPDMSAAKISAISIFNILDGEDEEDIQTKENSKMLKEGINGNIKFENISFQYEGRLNKVFEDLNFEIKNGEKVAFVGPSGCGKSTIIQLLLRFYFPEKGTITIGGTDIKDFDIHALRRKFGVVSQQPILFNRSFEENIVYNSEASVEEMKIAAKMSNAFSFIEGDQKIDAQNEQLNNNKDEGFNRIVGVKGLHISGGQKQRVAIARAIMRNPQILLLDEATSALDVQNEKNIQQCLDVLMNNKTTITVAHRFETIKNSDRINVLESGKIVEQGKYEDLINKKGYFYNLSKGNMAQK